MNSRTNRKLSWFKPIVHLVRGNRFAQEPRDVAFDLTALKEETLRWIFSIVGAVLVCLIVCNVVHATYHPDLGHLQDVAKNILLEPGKARPEPMEAVLFRVSIIVILPCLLGFYLLTLKWERIKSLARSSFFLSVSIASVVILILLIYFDFAIQNQADFGMSTVGDGAANSNFSGYFNGFFISEYLWLYTLVIAPLFAGLFFIGFKKLRWETNKAFRVIMFTLGYLVIGWVLLEIIA